MALPRAYGHLLLRCLPLVRPSRASASPATPPRSAACTPRPAPAPRRSRSCPPRVRRIFRASWQVSAAVVAATCAAAPACAAATWPGALFACFRRLASLCALHGLVYAMNCRSRRRGLPAARQEELVLIALITLAITTLISRLTPATREDYIYASFLIICGPSLLKIRWWIAMPAMAVPMATALVRHLAPPPPFRTTRCGMHVLCSARQAATGARMQAHSSAVIMPGAAKERVLVAWLAGGVMAWLVERYRRQTFAGQALAKAAHAKELEEKSAHLRAQADLAAAREEVRHVLYLSGTLVASFSSVPPGTGPCTLLATGRGLRARCAYTCRRRSARWW